MADIRDQAQQRGTGRGRYSRRTYIVMTIVLLAVTAYFVNWAGSLQSDKSFGQNLLDNVLMIAIFAGLTIAMAIRAVRAR